VIWRTFALRNIKTLYRTGSQKVFVAPFFFVYVFWTAQFRACTNHGVNKMKTALFDFTSFGNRLELQPIEVSLAWWQYVSDDDDGHDIEQPDDTPLSETDITE